MISGIVVAMALVEVVTGAGVTNSVEIALSFEKGRAELRIPYDSLPKDVSSVRIKADFARAKAGEAGYWVDSYGELGTFAERKENLFYRPERGAPMPFFGMKTERLTWVAIVKGMPFNFMPEIELRDGEYSFWPNFDRHVSAAKEDIVIEYRELAGEDADYSGMARAYREYQYSRGAVRTLKDRAKERPMLDYMARWPEVRVRCAWKPVPSPDPDHVDKNEPPVKAAITFDRFRDIVDEFKRQGIGGAEFCLVGWNIGGHDGRWPQVFPVEPSLGGEAKLKAAIQHARENGYYVSAHQGLRESYIVADSFDAEFVIAKDGNGKLKRGKGSWGGGRPYVMCPQRAYEKFAIREMPRIRAMGFEGLHYIDVFSCLPPEFCADPRHPLNERAAARYTGYILELARDVFGGAASEGSCDQNASKLDYILYASFARPFGEAKSALIDRYVPTFQIVYNGAILSNPFTTTVNYPIKGRPSELKAIEFGARPSYYFYANFRHAGDNWMGNEDFGCSTDEELRHAVSEMKRGLEPYAVLWPLQYRMMDRHEEVSPGVFKTTYEGGVGVYVNYNREERDVGGIRIPAEGWKATGL